MALTKAQVREILSSAGIDSDHMNDAVNKIIEGHTSSIEALREEKTSLKEEIASLQSEIGKHKEESGKLPEVQKELEDLKKQVEAKDYDKLLKEFEDYKTDVKNKEVRASKESAYKEILKDAGIPEKHFAKIIKYSDVDSIELDENGKAKDAKTILKSVKEEWDDHIEKTAEKGANTEKPPHNTGGSGKTKEEIMQIKDTSERQKAIAENPELFGIA